jgi:hypothetical protein
MLDGPHFGGVGAVVGDALLEFSLSSGSSWILRGLSSVI